MATRLKAVLPLTLSIGLLAFIASEVALNFTFHWVTVQDGVFGEYGLPRNGTSCSRRCSSPGACSSCSVRTTPRSGRP